MLFRELVHFFIVEQHNKMLTCGHGDSTVQAMIVKQTKCCPLMVWGRPIVHCLELKKRHAL